MVDVFDVVGKTGGFLAWDLILLAEQMMSGNMEGVGLVVGLAVFKGD